MSSPNTPGPAVAAGRRQPSTELIRALVAEAWALADGATPVPIFVKLAPDLTDDALEQALEVCTAAGAEGLIATNTTLARDGVAPTETDRAAEAGGLSGAPLTVRARQVVGFLAAADRRCRSSASAGS